LKPIEKGNKGMDVFDYNQKNVPEYRNNLYQDGYSPEQIL